MSWHPDKRVNQAFIGLMDALVSWGRNTGRGSKLFFFPEFLEEDGEHAIFLHDGKPVNITNFLIKTQLESIIEELE